MSCELLTVKEAAAQLRCSLSFVYKLMRNGELAFEQRGRRKLPLAASLLEYRERIRVVYVTTSDRQPPYRFQHLFKS